MRFETMEEDLAYMRKKVDEELEGFELDEVEGDESLEEIIQLAREDWEGDAGWREAKGHSQIPPTDNVLAVNYLRHQRTNYDGVLMAIHHLVTHELNIEQEYGPEWDEDANTTIGDTHDLDQIINEANRQARYRAMDAIAEKYPELSATAYDRMEPSTVIIDLERFYAGRMRF